MKEQRIIKLHSELCTLLQALKEARSSTAKKSTAKKTTAKKKTPAKKTTAKKTTAKKKTHKAVGVRKKIATTPAEERHVLSMPRSTAARYLVKHKGLTQTQATWWVNRNIPPKENAVEWELKWKPIVLALAEAGSAKKRTTKKATTRQVAETRLILAMPRNQVAPYLVKVKGMTKTQAARWVNMYIPPKVPEWDLNWKPTTKKTTAKKTTAKKTTAKKTTAKKTTAKKTTAKKTTRQRKGLKTKKKVRFASAVQYVG